jgi:hypothetical protein
MALLHSELPVHNTLSVMTPVLPEGEYRKVISSLAIPKITLLTLPLAIQISTEISN